MSTTNRHSQYSSTLNFDPDARVADELISNRAIWRKVFCILLCVIFVLNAWAAVILHAFNYSNETMLELSISIGVLLAGQYLGTGLVDAYWYLTRWKRSSHKSHSKQSEQNNEAWVCMRITLSLLGIAPISRYIESLLVVHRMLNLEKQYMHKMATVTKESERSGVGPSGSLISGPSVGVRQPESGRSGLAANSASSTIRRYELDAGLNRVYVARRQFRRTENDAAYVALASGVLGAGPFIISQGVLYFRRVGLNYTLETPTLTGILTSYLSGLSWLAATLTHFYPHAYDQSKLNFERGLGQVGPIGLVLLYFAHYIHLSLRCSVLVLFIAQFHWVAVGVIGFHFCFVLASLVTARACTNVDYSDMRKVERASVFKNLLSDVLFSYVSLFEFVNAYAKFTRTRYFCYYLLYYLENAAMVGAWYVYFTYPEMIYHLPALLIISVVQFLGFILFQVYLFFFSKSRRKTTLCGLCFRHLDGTEPHPYPPSGGRPTGSMNSFNRRSPQPQAPAPSALSANSAASRSTVYQDPVFGQKFSQTAVPKRKRTTSHHQLHQQSVQNNKPMSSVRTAAEDNESISRMYRHYSNKPADRSRDDDAAAMPMRYRKSGSVDQEDHHHHHHHQKGVYQPTFNNNSVGGHRHRWSSVTSNSTTRGSRDAYL